ncbi:diguanylate cyclase [Lachnospiraceae bacterium OttesenSCG-928-J05]|nr:diguanylate cyclase [Lachnospiraceae bacterium OttesenSCG-928-J05]
MNLFNDEKTSEYWVQTLDKLEDGNVDSQVLYEVLNEMCVFFDFEYSFTYHVNHDEALILDAYYKPATGSSLTPEMIDAKKELGEALFQAFKGGKLISCNTKGGRTTPLDDRLLELFHTKVLLLLPILDENSQLVGLIGMGDRREVRRTGELNKQLAFSILVLVANHVKLLINQRRMQQTEEALKTVLDNMGVDIYVNDFHTHEVLYVNKSMAAPYGGVEAMIGEKCYSSLYKGKRQQCDFCPQKQLLDEEGNPTKIYSWDYMRELDGSWFRVLSVAVNWEDGRTAHIVSSIDITEDKQVEEQIRKIAERDPLTGLANRRMFIERTRELIANQEEFHLIFFDLMKFKEINDNYGHRMGDEVLKTIGYFLQGQVSEECTCYRFGGDEFIVVVRDRSKAVAVKTAKKLDKRSRSIWSIKEQEMNLGFSIGIAKFPEDGKTSDEVLKAADEAMYESKRSGGGIYFYNEGKIASVDWITNLLT